MTPGQSACGRLATPAAAPTRPSREECISRDTNPCKVTPVHNPVLDDRSDFTHGVVFSDYVPACLPAVRLTTFIDHI